MKHLDGALIKRCNELETRVRELEKVNQLNAAILWGMKTALGYCQVTDKHQVKAIGQAGKTLAAYQLRLKP